MCTAIYHSGSLWYELLTRWVEELDIIMKARMSFSRIMTRLLKIIRRPHCEQFHVGIANICISFTDAFLNSYIVLWSGFFLLFFWCSENLNHLVQLCLKESIHLNGWYSIFKSLRITPNEDRWIKKNCGHGGQSGYFFMFGWTVPLMLTAPLVNCFLAPLQTLHYKW